MMICACSLMVAAVAASPTAVFKRTAVVVISHPAAEMPRESVAFAAAVVRESRRLADHSILQVRQANASTTCSLGSFAVFGVDTSLCGQARLAPDIERVIVFELDFDRGHPRVSAADFARAKESPRIQLSQLVSDGETRDEAVVRIFARLFAGYGRLQFGSEFGDINVYVDGHWIGEDAARGDYLAEVGRHTIEIRRGAQRERLSDVVVSGNGFARVDLPFESFAVAKR